MYIIILVWYFSDPLFPSNESNEKRTVCSFIRSSFVFAIFLPEKLIFQRKDGLWTNAIKWERLERFNNDSFEWAMTATTILNFSKTKSNKKTQKYSHISTAEKLHSTRPIHYIVVVYVSQSLKRPCSRCLHCSRSEVVHQCSHTKS